MENEMSGSSATVPVGDGALGRVMDQVGVPLDGLGDFEHLHHAPRTVLTSVVEPTDRRPAMLETGIKVIDLLAPLVHGGTVRLSGPAGAGIMVTVGECTRRIAARGAGCTVYIGWQERFLQVEDVVREWREQGIDRLIATVLGRDDAHGAARQRALETGLTLAGRFADAGRDVLLAIEEAAFLEGDVRQVLDGRYGRGRAGRITGALLDVWREGTPGDLATRPVCDTHLVFDAGLAKRYRYPAIDPLRSASILLGGQALSVLHRRVADRARALLERSRELLATVERNGGETLSPEDDEVAQRGRRLERFLTQPYFVAEPFTGIPGEDVSLDRMIADAQAIIDGRYDAVPEEAFGYTGTMDQVIEKARLI